MKEGYWINFENNLVFQVDDHERWLRRNVNAEKIGVLFRIIDLFDKFTPVEDRYEFLLTVIANAPIIRVRGHGAYITFEFCSEETGKVFNVILRFCLEVEAGEYTELHMVNFANTTVIDLMFHEFNSLMQQNQMKKIIDKSITFNVREKYLEVLREKR